MSLTSRPTGYDPEPARCGVCHKRHRSNAAAFECERAHDAEARAKTITETTEKAA